MLVQCFRFQFNNQVMLPDEWFSMACIVLAIFKLMNFAKYIVIITHTGRIQTPHWLIIHVLTGRIQTPHSLIIHVLNSTKPFMTQDSPRIKNRYPKNTSSRIKHNHHKTKLVENITITKLRVYLVIHSNCFLFSVSIFIIVI